MQKLLNGDPANLEPMNAQTLLLLLHEIFDRSFYRVARSEFLGFSPAKGR